MSEIIRKDFDESTMSILDNSGSGTTPDAYQKAWSLPSYGTAAVPSSNTRMVRLSSDMTDLHSNYAIVIAASTAASIRKSDLLVLRASRFALEALGKNSAFYDRTITSGTLVVEPHVKSAKPEDLSNVTAVLRGNSDDRIKGQAVYIQGIGDEEATRKNTPSGNHRQQRWSASPSHICLYMIPTREILTKLLGFLAPSENNTGVHAVTAIAPIGTLLNVTVDTQINTTSCTLCWARVRRKRSRLFVPLSASGEITATAHHGVWGWTAQEDNMGLLYELYSLGSGTGMGIDARISDLAGW
ncbi:hypothetical protein BC629DRAFT_1440304 [Irpex lacteus]|nr:hypothetical protein BC629DRAFT_1440304 [Irpex lacteus]